MPYVNAEITKEGGTFQRRHGSASQQRSCSQELKGQQS